MRKIHDLELFEETKKLGGFTTTYRIHHRPLTQVGGRYVPGLFASVVGYAVKTGSKWTMLFTDGEVATEGCTLRAGCWNLAH